MDTKATLRVLRKEWDGCSRCNLAALRDNEDRVVFGTGAIQPDYLFVYDAPEEADTKTGTPLMGRHGEILYNLIKKAEYESYAVTTVVGCRAYTVLPPIEDQPEQIRDRDPSTEEVDECRPRLDALIYALDPRLIFAVGQVAWKTLVKPKDRGGHNVLSDAAGELTSTYVMGKVRPVRYAVMPLLPPKQIIANPTSADHGPIATTLEALIRARTYVNMLKKDEAAT
jgi:DNA polymerase